MSDQWLAPLAHSLGKYKHSLAYPVLDVLTVGEGGAAEVSVIVGSCVVVCLCADICCESVVLMKCGNVFRKS